MTMFSFSRIRLQEPCLFELDRTTKQSINTDKKLDPSMDRFFVQQFPDMPENTKLLILILKLWTKINNYSRYWRLNWSSRAKLVQILTTKKQSGLIFIVEYFTFKLACSNTLSNTLYIRFYVHSQKASFLSFWKRRNGIILRLRAQKRNLIFALPPRN